MVLNRINLILKIFVPQAPAIHQAAICFFVAVNVDDVVFEVSYFYSSVSELILVGFSKILGILLAQ